MVSCTWLVARQIIGFLTSDFILALQWDHIYTANYFLALMGLLAASLAACTSTRCTAQEESSGLQPKEPCAGLSAQLTATRKLRMQCCSPTWLGVV